jgi:hypothetical protein
MSAVHGFPRVALEQPNQPLPLDLRRITVLFTNLQATARAVAVARQLGVAFGAEVAVLVLQRTLMQPHGTENLAPSHGESDTLRRQLRASGADVKFRVVVASKTRAALRFMLPRRSLVVVGGRPCWWPTSASRLRRLLEAEGHCVLLVPDVAPQRLMSRRSSES